MSKNRKKPLSQRICETLDIPVGTFGRISFIEAVSNRELCIDGCEGLITYTEDLVVLVLCDGLLTVKGSGLELRSFSGGRVSVSGIISTICYGAESEAVHDG
ncbi:MAG: YabP/YqfC family sporulation protein [Clostridia bacterium]|nr:YabP/YqfC family sporulation protein [Clostridia bacterium]